MDTSKEYVEMCQKAEELQKLTPGMGVSSDIPIAITDGNWFYVDGLRTTWLPRQDQLQNMLKDKYQSKGYMLVICFVDWMKKGGLDKTMVSLCSMEQLWLAFIMHENYGKRWDGTSWVVE